MNDKIKLFNEVNVLMQYDLDPIGTTAWWSDTNRFLGSYDDWPFSRGPQSPLRVLTRFFPDQISREEFIYAVNNEIEHMSRGME